MQQMADVWQTSTKTSETTITFAGISTAFKALKATCFLLAAHIYLFIYCLSMQHFIIHVEEVHRQKTHLNTNKSEGADEIHPICSIYTKGSKNFVNHNLIIVYLSRRR